VAVADEGAELGRQRIVEGGRLSREGVGPQDRQRAREPGQFRQYSAVPR
jgi:hypothetical protein